MRASEAFQTAYDALLAMVVKHHGHDARDWSVDGGGLHVDLGDVILGIGSTPNGYDEPEPPLGCNVLFMLARTPEMQSRLDALPNLDPFLFATKREDKRHSEAGGVAAIRSRSLRTIRPACRPMSPFCLRSK